MIGQFNFQLDVKTTILSGVRLPEVHKRKPDNNEHEQQKEKFPFLKPKKIIPVEESSVCLQFLIKILLVSYVRLIVFSVIIF